MNYTKCELNEFPCVNIDYKDFDTICYKELALRITADKIINESSFCTHIPTDEACSIEDLESSDYLKTLKGRVGIYHLWVDYDYCDDHEKYTMLCFYVGEGIVKNRLSEHIKNKWPPNTYNNLYVSFYECEKRIALYLESLFLGIYNFHLNIKENTGTKTLYAVWDENRRDLGTEINSVSEILNNKLGPGPDY